MKKSTQRKPTDAEMEILQVLWRFGPVKVRFVNEQLNQLRKIGYTTTLKTMQIMMEKGMVSRVSRGKGHVYRAELKEGETQKVLLDRFLDIAFGGSAKKLVMQALGNRTTSKKELAEIKEYLAGLEGEET